MSRTKKPGIFEPGFSLFVASVDISRLLRFPMPAAILTINPRLGQMLHVVVIRGHLRVVGDVQRLGVFVFAGGVRVGQGFLSDRGDTRSLIVVGAMFNLGFSAAEHVLAFVAARPVDGVDRHAFVFITTVGLHRWHRGAGGLGLDVAAFGHDAGGDDGEGGEQKQEANVHRDFLFKGAVSDR